MRRAGREATGWSVGRTVALWLAGSAVGVAVVAVPDSDERVVSLSRTHGPSPVDLVGVAVLVAAWLPVLLLLTRRRHALRGGWARAALLLAVVGGAGLVVTLGLDLGPVYLVPVVLLVAAQLAALRACARPGPSPGPAAQNSRAVGSSLPDSPT